MKVVHKLNNMDLLSPRLIWLLDLQLGVYDYGLYSKGEHQVSASFTKGTVDSLLIKEEVVLVHRETFI